MVAFLEDRSKELKKEEERLKPVERIEKRLERWEILEETGLDYLKRDIVAINNPDDVEKFKKAVNRWKRYANRRMLVYAERARSYEKVLIEKFPDKASGIRKDVSELISFATKIIETLEALVELNIGRGVTIDDFKIYANTCIDKAIDLNNSMIAISRNLVEMASPKGEQKLMGAGR